MTLKKCLFWSNRANSTIQATVQFGCLGDLAVGCKSHQPNLNAPWQILREKRRHLDLQSGPSLQ